MRCVVCAALWITLSACGASHPPSEDGGADGGIDASVAHDAGVVCAEGSACDDGDACTTDDRCRAGACAGTPRACESPPGACFESAGACVEGECVYEPTDGAPCDDGDACTSADTCSSGGACRGEAIACDAPPPPECASDGTLRVFEAGTCVDGACAYAPVERPCRDGCADGACRCVPIPWEFTIVEREPAEWRGPTTGALAADAAGGVHVLYPMRLDGAERPILRYAHGTPDGRWTSEELADGEEGWLGVDATGTLHAIYRDNESQELVYAQRAPAGEWTTSVVPDDATPDELERAFAVSFGDSGEVHIARANLLGDLVYIERSASGEWGTDVGPRVTRAPAAIGLDAAGRVHIIHQGAGELRHAVRAALGVWSTSTVRGWSTSILDLGRDPAGGMQMMFVEGGGSGYRLMHGASPSPADPWVFEMIAEAGDHGVAMATDGDRTHAVFLAPVSTWFSEVQHAWRNEAGAWQVESISGDPINGSLWAAIAGRDGVVHLALRSPEHALVYGRRRVCP